MFWTHFDDYAKTADYNGIGVKEQYERKSMVAGIGAVFSF